MKRSILVAAEILAFILLLPPPCAVATPQIGDYLDYGGERVEFHDFPLDQYFEQEGVEQYPFQMTSTACWRGYIGLWKFEGKKLYLRSLHKQASYDSEQASKDPDYKYSVFGDKVAVEGNTVERRSGGKGGAGLGNVVFRRAASPSRKEVWTCGRWPDLVGEGS